MPDRTTARIIERTDRTLAQLEQSEIDQMEASLDASYTRLERQLLARYPEYTADAKPDLLATQRGVLLAQELKDQLILINPQQEQQIEARYRRLLSTVSREGTTLADELVKLEQGDGFVRATATVPVEAVAAAATGAKDRLKRWDQDFRNKSVALIQQGLIQGWGSRRVAQLMRQQLGVTKGRANAIARTEIITAQDTATRANYKANGVQYYVRIATMDERLCPWCSERAGKGYPVDVPIVIHPQDRCYAAPWLPEQEETDEDYSDWIKEHAADSRARTEDQLRTGPAPFERAAQAAAAQAVWTPQQGYVDKAVEQRGIKWAQGLLVWRLLNAPQRDRTPEQENNDALIRSLVIGAAVVGTGVAAYYLLRQRYRNGFGESARQAAAMADGMTVVNLADDVEQITFVAGGFAGQRGLSGLEYAPLFGEFLPGHHMIGVETPEFDVGPPITEGVPQHMAAQYANMLDIAVVQGRNPSAVRMAAQAAAYYRTYGKPVNLVGYSAGGMVAAEAHEILKTMGVPTKTAAIATPWFGFTDLSTEELITLFGANDQFAGFPAQNRVVLNDVDSHWLDAYLDSDEFPEAMQSWFGIRQPRQAERPEQSDNEPTTVDIDVVSVEVEESLTNDALILWWPQVGMLTPNEIDALPGDVARKVRALRGQMEGIVGQLPGRLDPLQLPGRKELLALPEGKRVRGLLAEGKVPVGVLPPDLEIERDLARTSDQLKRNVSRNIYTQARTAERRMRQAAEAQIRSAIQRIKAEDLPMLPKLDKMREATWRYLQPTIRRGVDGKAPGVSDPERFDKVDFLGVEWYLPEGMGERSRSLDLLRKMAELNPPLELTKQVDAVYLSRQSNAYEQFWRKKLKQYTAQVRGTVRLEDRAIGLYRNKGKVEDVVLQMGHMLAYAKYGQLEPPANSAYRRAMNEGDPITVAGRRGPAQDFAESVKEFLVDPDRLRKFNPQRYEVSAQILGIRISPTPPTPPRRVSRQDASADLPEGLSQGKTADHQQFAERLRYAREQEQGFARQLKAMEPEMDELGEFYDQLIEKKGFSQDGWTSEELERAQRYNRLLDEADRFQRQQEAFKQERLSVEVMERGRRVLSDANLTALEESTQGMDATIGDIEVLQKRLIEIGPDLAELFTELGDFNAVPSGTNNLLDESREIMQLLQRGGFPEEAEPAIEAMGRIRNQLLQGMSQEAADELVFEILIDTSTMPVYDFDRLEQDIAEFFRLTVGRGFDTLTDVVLDRSRGYANRTGTLNIGNYPEDKQKLTLWHELGHHLEYSSNSTLNAAKAWLQVRATDSPKPLKNIDPKGDYEDDELAYPDEWAHPYAGKWYVDATEVVSMGIQNFSRPEDMLRLYLTDREHFFFILGAIRDAAV